MKQLTDSLYQIGFGPVNAYLIEDNGFTLIDTGLPGSAEKLFAEMKKAGKNPDKITSIILTHSHTDHAGSVADLVSRLNIPVMAYGLDADLIEKGIASRPMSLVPGIKNWLLYNLFIKKTSKTIAPVKISRRLNDLEVLPVGSGLQIIHTPGHSAGHISLLMKKEGVLIAGDICSNMPGLSYGPVYENLEVGKSSLQKVCGFDFNRVVFGHGNMLEDALDKMKAEFGVKHGAE